SMLRNILYALGGITALIFASKAIIDGASRIAEHFGISQIVIGMTVVAVGTSLPELAASIMAQVKNESDISIGNVIGSNLFNMFFVAGGAAAVKGLPINLSIYTFEVPYMLIFSLLLFPVIFISKGISRLHAAGLLLLYVSFVLISFLWR
ncbi:MAG: sodium:calcium antiporter, partial [Candidatus Marinimicrobia bacterium]|nr:sodium:calcium antiporter [Candidatus Neomarinimicrobiota bacterium]